MQSDHFRRFLGNFVRLRPFRQEAECYTEIIKAGRKTHIQPAKGVQMFSRRLFTIFIFVALLAVIALTVSEAVATTRVISQSECVSMPSPDSIHSEYVTEKGAWVTYTEKGPAGIDGGLIHILSDARTCTRSGVAK
jgi:hypothetical protein